MINGTAVLEGRVATERQKNAAERAARSVAGVERVRNTPLAEGIIAGDWWDVVEKGGFAMLGKTFKGLTDEMLAWQTKLLVARAGDVDVASVASE